MKAAVVDRLRAVGDGATINGTYAKMPIEALDAFRADLIALADMHREIQTCMTDGDDIFPDRASRDDAIRSLLDEDYRR